MSGKLRIGLIAALAVAAVVVFGALLAPRMEGGPTRPASDIPLVASFRDLVLDGVPADRIVSDGQGPYVDGVTSAGIVDVHLSKPGRLVGGTLSIDIENGGYINDASDEILGRSVGLKFDQYAYSCTVDNRLDSTALMDFDVCYNPEAPCGTAALVETQWVTLRTYYTYLLGTDGFYHNDELEVLDFTKMGVNGNPAFAYVGMSINFGAALHGGLVSDKYWVGFNTDPVEVLALNVGPNGPAEWIIRPIQDENVLTRMYYKEYYKNYLPARMLLKIHYTKANRYDSYCYGLFKVPFELHLIRK